MKRSGMAVVAVLAFVAGMLAAGGSLHAHGDEVTALASFSDVAGKTKDDNPRTLTFGWVVKDGEVYHCRREVYPEKTPFTCKRQELVFE